MTTVPSVAALAGRRIDPPDADPPRFPAEEEQRVAATLERELAAERVAALVCSAACGADILALEAAARQGIAATIVLPFAEPRFRERSVTDRGAGWGERFDRLVARARADGRLVEMGRDPDDAEAYFAANGEILRRASALPQRRRIVFAVWDGRPRGSDDATADLLARAGASGYETRTILTRRSGR